MSLTKSMEDVPGDEEPAPSYEESTGSNPHYAPPQNPPSKQSPSLLDPPSKLHQQLSDVRTQRIQNLISAYVDPLLLQAVQAGLSRTTLFLVPSNVSALQQQQQQQRTSEKEPAASGAGAGKDDEEQAAIVVEDAADLVVSCSRDANPRLIRLRGAENSLEFWRQPAVLTELESALKARLRAEGMSIFEAQTLTPASASVGSTTTAPTFSSQAPSSSSSSPSEAHQSSVGRGSSDKETWLGGIFRRKKSGGGDGPAVVDDSGGGRNRRAKAAIAELLDPPPPAPRQQKRIPGPGEVSVRVALKNAVFRVVTDMGLYDTKSGKAVVVEMEIGG